MLDEAIEYLKQLQLQVQVYTSPSVITFYQVLCLLLLHADPDALNHVNKRMGWPSLDI